LRLLGEEESAQLISLLQRFVVAAELAVENASTVGARTAQ